MASSAQVLGQLESGGATLVQGGVESGLGITGSSTAAAGLGGGLATMGIAAAASFGVNALINVLSCGTITQEGCAKRLNASQKVNYEDEMWKLTYALEQGQVSFQQYQQAAQTLWAQVVQQSGGAGSKSMTIMGQGGLTCGEASKVGVPLNSQTYQILCGAGASAVGAGPTCTDGLFCHQINFAQDGPIFLEAAQQIAAKQSSALGGAGGFLGISTGSSGGILLLAIAAVVLLLVLRR